MKALIQRVSEAKVVIEEITAGEIGRGLLIFLCAVKGDAEQDLNYMLRKISNLRIFDDSEGKMNLSLKDIRGEALVVSQFTLSARTRKGNRPSFDDAETPQIAEDIYNSFIQGLGDMGIHTASGRFGQYMSVSLINDGPVTIFIDTRDGR